MDIKTAFNTLLYTRGALTKLGMSKEQVYVLKKRIEAKPSKWPKDTEMRKWLLLAGWKNTPEKWREPKK